MVQYQSLSSLHSGRRNNCMPVHTYTNWNGLMEKPHTTYTSIDHLNNVNAFHRLIEKWYKGYNGVASKYIIRYTAQFTLVREYTGFDSQEILLSIKKRMHQITDFFRIVDMKKDDLFIYSIP